jgi:NAD(P)-dependent dehydrogenase (short-subunit alcohol dehydrogenase family)
MAWALVTPSSRGIGHALTRHLLRTTPPTLPIVVTARTNLDETRQSLLSDLPIASQSASRLDIQQCDFDSEASIRDLASYCAERYNDRTKDPSAHLRLAFCIPGMLVPERAPEKIEYESALATLKMNLLAPMMLAKHFIPLLPKKTQTSKQPLPKVSGLSDLAVLAFMSARVGSISDNARGGWYSYRSSKAGVNQLVKSLNIHVKMSSGGSAVCVGLHPGTVKTDLSKEFWASTPKEKLFDSGFSAERLVEVVRDLEGKGGGRCWDWKGEEIMP